MPNSRAALDAALGAFAGDDTRANGVRLHVALDRWIADTCPSRGLHDGLDAETRRLTPSRRPPARRGARRGPAPEVNVPDLESDFLDSLATATRGLW